MTISTSRIPGPRVRGALPERPLESGATYRVVHRFLLDGEPQAYGATSTTE